MWRGRPRPRTVLDCPRKVSPADRNVHSNPAGRAGAACPGLRERQGPGKALIVIVFVPVAVGAPSALVFIPPAMLLAPATLPCFVQFAALVTCLVAVASMFLNGLMEFMFRMRDPPLTAVDVFGVNSGRCTEEKDCGQDRAVKKRRNYACKLLSTNHKLSLTGHMRMKWSSPVQPIAANRATHTLLFPFHPGLFRIAQIPFPQTIVPARSPLRMWSGHSCPLPLRLVLFFVLIAQFHPNQSCPAPQSPPRTEARGRPSPPQPQTNSSGATRRNAPRPGLSTLFPLTTDPPARIVLQYLARLTRDLVIELLLTE
jgi:hypothetical protein